MSDAASAQSLGQCGWCDEEAVTHVIVRPGRKNRKVAPVCERHAQHFEDRDQMTVRVEIDQKLERERKKSQWKGRRWR